MRMIPRPRQGRPSIGLTAYIFGLDEALWDEGFRLAREAEAEHLELWLAYPLGNGALRERQLRRLRHHLKGLGLLVHLPTAWESLITPHKELRELSLEEARSTMAVAAKLGARWVILTGGRAFYPRELCGVDFEATFRMSVEELLPYAEELGLSLAVENLARGYPASGRELKGLAEMGLGLSLDLAQLQEGGEEPLAVLDLVLERLINLRIQLDLPRERRTAVFDYLRGGGFTGYLTLAVSPGKPPGDMWERLREELAGWRASWPRLGAGAGSGTSPSSGSGAGGEENRI